MAGLPLQYVQAAVILNDALQFDPQRRASRFKQTSGPQLSNCSTTSHFHPHLSTSSYSLHFFFLHEMKAQQKHWLLQIKQELDRKQSELVVEEVGKKMITERKRTSQWLPKQNWQGAQGGDESPKKS